MSASDWPSIDPESVGIEREALSAATAFVRQHNSTAFLLAHTDGLVCAEYWHCEEGFGGDNSPLAPTFTDDDRSLEDVASLQKSVVSVLVGIAVGNGLLTVADSVTDLIGPGWSHASPSEESKITVRHLLTMTSGLDHGGRFAAPAGSVWMYNLGPAWHTLKRVLSKVAGKPLNGLLEEWLTGPLGMFESQFVERPAGPEGRNSIGASSVYADGKPFEGFVSSGFDLLRFGVGVCTLIRGDGDLGMDAEYLAASLQPSTELNPSYGYLWWLNGQAFSLAPMREDPIPGPMVPAAPDDMVSGLGALGRAVHVIPSRQLVVVRMGGSPSEQVLAASQFGRNLFERLRLT